MWRPLNVLLIFATVLTAQTQAQGSAQAAETPVYLLRLQRASFLQSVCVLLSGDGSYHLERHNLRKVRVFEGKLDDEELRNIVRIVSGDRLFNLDQEQIPDLMLKADEDQVILTIHRPGSWQKLAFPDSASREPFRDALDPLLKWLSSVDKRKKRELSEEVGRNNCLPTAKPEFAQRGQSQTEPTVASGTPPRDAPPPSYVVQMFDNRMVDGHSEVSCLLISTSGAYHLVKQSKRYGKGLSNAVLDGTLAPAEQLSLRTILDAPALVNQADQKLDQEVIFMGTSYLTSLLIPRGKRTQKFAAWKSYRIVNQTLTQSMEEHGTELLAPFREWLKAHINAQNAIPITTPPNPRCSPDR